jgi:predicted enzyme related to lactoylglutathione lyase
MKHPTYKKLCLTILTAIFIVSSYDAISAQTIDSKNSGAQMKKNPGSYFEIPVTDMNRAIKFYSSVFGYDFTRENIHGNEMAMFPLNPYSEGISGALAKGEIYIPSKTGSLIYLNVSNIEETLELVKKQGGAILFPKTKAGEYGYVAEFEDSESNRVALFQSLDE